MNPNCRKQIDDQFYFCPYCGEDNRAPESRFEPAKHVHQYPGPGSYHCIWCGEQRGGSPITSRRWRKPILTFITSAVFFYVLSISFIAYVTYSSSEPNVYGFGTWCRHTVTVYSRHGSRTVTRGWNIIEWEILSIVVFGLCIFKYGSSRGFWDYDNN